MTIAHCSGDFVKGYRQVPADTPKVYQCTQLNGTLDTPNNGTEASECENTCSSDSECYAFWKVKGNGKCGYVKKGTNDFEGTITGDTDHDKENANCKVKLCKSCASITAKTGIDE